MHLVKNLNKT